MSQSLKYAYAANLVLKLETNLVILKKNILRGQARPVL